MERKTLGILGNNLGGLISCYAGWTRDVYGKVGCMSSSFWWDANDYQKDVITKGLPSTPFPQIYMDSGTQGGEANCTIYTTEIYNYQLSKGFISNVTAWQYVQQGGAHNEASWAKRFNEPIGALYPPNTV